MVVSINSNKVKALGILGKGWFHESPYLVEELLISVSKEVSFL